MEQESLATNTPDVPVSAVAQPRPRGSKRNRARNVGMSGNFWYAVAFDTSLRPKQVREVVFWGSSIAVYRGTDGKVRAIENRCAHRQLRLTEGIVEGNLLTCTYHGWKYDGSGTCVKITHELGKGRTQLPKICVRSYPVKIKYGLIWIFPGNPALADSVDLPEIEELDGSEPWPMEPMEFTIKAHFSMIVENVCDFNHEFLHRKMKPFSKPTLLGYERQGTNIILDYNTKVGGTGVRWLTENAGAELDHMRLWYQYPYQRSNTKGKYISWLLMLPVSPSETKCFFLPIFGAIEIPGIRVPVPFRLRSPLLRAVNALYVKPLLGQDRRALEEEQRAYTIHSDKPSVELNPIVKEFQKLTVEQWDLYVQGEATRAAEQGIHATRLRDLGAGLRAADFDAMTSMQDTSTTKED